MVATAAFISLKEFLSAGRWEVDLQTAFEYLIVMLGVLLPDIDHPNSTIGRRVKYIAYPVYFIFGHRGITHSILFIFVIYSAGLYFDSNVIKYLSMGAALHLLGDYLTPSGIPLLYPYKKNFRALIVADTNGFSETFLSVSILFLSIMYVTDII